MDKQQFLSLVKSIAQRKLVSRSELLSAYEGGQISPDLSPLSNSKYENLSTLQRGGSNINVAEALYWIGGGIVTVGIVILVSLNWVDINDLSRLLVTLGLAALMYVAGVLLDHGDQKSKLGTGFHLIAALVLPVGLGVAFDQAHLLENGISAYLTIAGILFAVYGLSALLFKRTIFMFFAALYGTGFFLTAVAYFTRNSIFQYEFYAYVIAGLGITHLFLGHAANEGGHRGLSNLLYVTGTGAFLGSLLALGGYRPVDIENIIWAWSYLGFVFGMIFISVRLQSRAILLISSLFMVIYIIKITNEYFTDTIGWPVTVIVGGFIVMAVGYLVYHHNKKYIAK